MNDLVSSCCLSGMRVVGGDEGTNHYECKACTESCNFQERNPTPPKPTEDWLEDLVQKICMHSVKDADGKVTIVYEGLSPAQIKLAIQSKIELMMLEAQINLLERVKNIGTQAHDRVSTCVRTPTLLSHLWDLEAQKLKLTGGNHGE